MALEKKSVKKAAEKKAEGKKRESGTDKKKAAKRK